MELAWALPMLTYPEACEPGGSVRSVVLENVLAVARSVRKLVSVLNVLALGRNMPPVSVVGWYFSNLRCLYGPRLFYVPSNGNHKIVGYKFVGRKYARVKIQRVYNIDASQFYIYDGNLYREIANTSTAVWQSEVSKRDVPALMWLGVKNLDI